MDFYERFFAQHKTFVLKIAIFFIYLLIIYPACPARGKKSDDSTCTSHRFFFLSAEDASRAERSRELRPAHFVLCSAAEAEQWLPR